jgi:hypothetical protein
MIRRRIVRNKARSLNAIRNEVYTHIVKDRKFDHALVLVVVKYSPFSRIAQNDFVLKVAQERLITKIVLCLKARSVK